jgi:hypothetical protein
MSDFHIVSTAIFNMRVLEEYSPPPGVSGGIRPVALHVFCFTSYSQALTSPSSMMLGV